MPDPGVKDRTARPPGDGNLLQGKPFAGVQAGAGAKPARATHRRWIIAGLKYSASVAILAALVVLLIRGEAFSQLASHRKQWGLLGASFALCLASVLITFFRWYLLARAVGLDFRLSSALQFGFLGYLFNFISLGTVGGDAFKAVLLARQQHKHRTRAVATVIVDRMVGLYALGLIASGGVLATGFETDRGEFRLLAQATLGVTLIGTLGLALFLWPGFTTGRFSEWLLSRPKLGAVLRPVVDSLRMFRHGLRPLGVAIALSLLVHTLSTVAIYLIARGLFGEAPSLAAHFVIAPLGMLAAALPLPLGALGAFEAALAALYVAVPGGVHLTQVQGLLVAFGYRAITILIAMIGVGVWLGSRRQVAEATAEAETLPAAV